MSPRKWRIIFDLDRGIHYSSANVSAKIGKFRYAYAITFSKFLFFTISQFDNELFIRSYLFATSLDEKYRTVTSHFYALSFAEYGNRTKPRENREKNWRNSTALHIFSNIGESINIVEKSIRNMYFLPRTLRKIYISITFSMLLLKEILAKPSYLYNTRNVKFTRVECRKYSQNLSRYLLPRS